MEPANDNDWEPPTHMVVDEEHWLDFLVILERGMNRSRCRSL